MTHKFTIFILLLLAAICALITPASALSEDLNKVTSYRISKSGESIRFVIDTVKYPEYLITTRHKPERLVIELKSTIWDNMGKQKVAGDITGVRYNSLSDNILQIVVDFKNPFTVKKYFTLPPKDNVYRLVIDIEQNGAANTAGFIPVPKLKEIKKPVIAVDAGHGGHDPGATGYHGTLEKNLTLSYAYAIKKALLDTGKYEVILTRKDDNYIDLKKRIEIARNAKANIFISIHADSHNNNVMSGLSVYTLSEKASDKEAEALAQKENSAGVLGNVNIKADDQDITELLIDLVQRETKNLSADFAENILKETSAETELLHQSPHRFAGFRVLTSPEIPSVLIELGYLSNKKEEKMLLSSAHKKKLAVAIVRAIDNHFGKYPLE